MSADPGVTGPGSRRRPGPRMRKGPNPIRAVVITLAVILAPSTLSAQAAGGGEPAVSVRSDILYATVDGIELRLDLHLPNDRVTPPLVVWVHGGAWRSGSKADVPRFFADNGYAVASVDFRQTPQAPFPANVHDIKAAIRFLRSMAQTYGYSAERIAIAGSSSGGHLAALVGVTAGVTALEGSVGSHPGESSAVQAIVSYYGASNLTTILNQSTPFGLGVRVPALELLLGAQPDSVPELARLASPVFHVDASDPPLLLLHGDQDPQMPINQSHELHGAYEALGLDAAFHVVHGATHDSSPFLRPEQNSRVLSFLARTIGEP